MELIQVRDEILKKIKCLEEGRLKFKQRSADKATAISNYDRKLAIEIIKIKNGQTTEIDGLQIPAKLSASEREKIAKGLCADEKLDVEMAEGMYKAAVSNMNALQAELNGLQSINKHLD